MRFVFGQTSKEKTQDINLRLAVMASLNPYGWSHSLEAISEVCGCGRESIRCVERKALFKLRNLLACLKE